MDIYGIGLGMIKAVENYIERNRCTGKTTALAYVVNEDDIIIFAKKQHAVHFFKYVYPHDKVKPRYFICANLQELNILLGSGEQGKIYYDHKFVEMCYTQAVDVTNNTLKRFAQ